MVTSKDMCADELIGEVSKQLEKREVKYTALYTAETSEEVNLSDHLSEPGIRRGNEDSRGNENRKSRNKISSMRKKSTSILFSL